MYQRTDGFRAAAVKELLCVSPPLNSLDALALDRAVAAARFENYQPGQLILDAFAEHTTDIYIVVDGEVGLWHDPGLTDQEATERLTRGQIFAFSASLTGDTVGPKASACTQATVARVPASLVSQAFSTDTGSRFLASHTTDAHRRSMVPPSCTMVDDMVFSEPIVVAPDTPVAEVAAQMSARRFPCAVVQLGAGDFGLITDSALLERIVVRGTSTTTHAHLVMQYPAPTTVLGESSADALHDLLDADNDFLVVVNRHGELHGILSARDFVVAPASAGLTIHEQIRRASSLEELIDKSHLVPSMLDSVLNRGLASGRVIAAYSAIVDTVIRRAIQLVFDRHPELSANAFTWLSLGSNGRREAVLSSDVDAAVAFDDEIPTEALAKYRAAFSEVNQIISSAGISIDTHGATPARPAFSRFNKEWHLAGQQWLASAGEDQGAIMASLLVDARPIHGDPGIPEVARVFGSFRRHPATMQLLLDESLSHRAKLRTMRDVLHGRGDRFDVKVQALLPIVNIARWAALGVGSSELQTTKRLRAAAGSELLPEKHSSRLIEVFDVLQHLRLRYQLGQISNGEPPSDLLDRSRMSRIDRGVVMSAVREIAGIQKRMDRLADAMPAQKLADASPAGAAQEQS
jgi:CBS domain-containing protein